MNTHIKQSAKCAIISTQQLNVHLQYLNYLILELILLHNRILHLYSLRVYDYHIFKLKIQYKT